MAHGKAKLTPAGRLLLVQRIEGQGWPPALRHTCAALLIAQGAHPKAIQSHLGHQSITTTLDRYGHLFEDEHEKLAERIDAAYADLIGPDSATPGQRISPGAVDSPAA